jgi:glucuronokinase
MIIRTKAYARAGLVGNPSDGYFGKTISLIVRNFEAEVVLYESPDVEILPNRRDQSRFPSLSALAEDVAKFGYYGGIRLLKATIKAFYDYCGAHGIALDNRNFTIRYRTTIPSQVGMAGSSAIITACLRALMAFYGVTIPKFIQPNLILGVETRELGIPAGLQDRVIQVHEGVVYMDFSRELMEKQGYGRYEELDPALLPPLYLAYRTDLAEGTEIFHNDIRGRFNRGEPAVVDAMKFWADLTDRVKDCLLRKDWSAIPALLNQNFDKRREIYRISEGNLRMVDVARSTGASAKFTGSGGAIVGTYPDEPTFEVLKERLGAMGVEVLKPIILTDMETQRATAPMPASLS